MDGSNGYYGRPPMMNAPQIFGNLNANGSPMPASLPANMFLPDDLDDGHDQGDPKRRRIARVCATLEEWPQYLSMLTVPGMRHVSQEENQMRRQDALLHPLYQLQDRVYLHPGRKEAPTTKRVRKFIPEHNP